MLNGRTWLFWQDVYWSKLLWQCVDKDSYQGCSLPERQDPTDEEHPCNNEEGPCSGFEGAGKNHEEQSSGFEGADQNQDLPEMEFSRPVVNEDEWSDGWK